jgi:hypothetical protein
MFLSRPWVWLVIVLVVEAVILTLGQADFVASDPLWYADIAHRISVDPSAVFTPHEHHPFVMRIGLTIPLALLYLGLGVSTFVSNLPALLSALTIIIVVYLALETPRAKLVGLFFCLCSPALLHNGTILNIDLPSSALLAISILCLSRRDDRHGSAYIAGAMVSWFACFLVKETAVWAAPIWCYAMVVDLRKLGSWKAVQRYAPALVVGTALAGAYLVWCWLVFGSPWARFQGISDLTYEHTWSFAHQPARAWLARLSWQPAWLFVHIFKAVLVPFVLGLYVLRARQNIWVVASYSVIVFYWFGSSTFSAYYPLPISPRMILPVLPSILVVAAQGVDFAWDKWAPRKLFWVALVALGGVILAEGVGVTGAVLSRTRPETIAFGELRKRLLVARRTILVCAEPRCVDIAPFFLSFDPPPNVSIQFAADFARAPLPDAVVMALVNRPRARGARVTDPALDYSAKIDDLGLPFLAGDNDVHLVDAGSGEALWRGLQ